MGVMSATSSLSGVRSTVFRGPAIVFGNDYFSGEVPMRKHYAWPQGHWAWPIKVTHKHGVRCGQMIWVGGQVDLTSSGEVRHANDLGAQVRSCMTYFDRVLQALDTSLVDLVKLL